MVQHMDRKYMGIASAARRKERRLDAAEFLDSTSDEAPGKELRLMLRQMPDVDPKLLALTLRPRAAARRIVAMRQANAVEAGKVSKRQARRAKRLAKEVLK